MALDYIERKKSFWSKVEKTDTCWLWRGRTSANGYGRFALPHLQGALAHRVSWEYTHSSPIPEGMILMHSCDVRNCVNPNHLELGDHDQNMRDMVLRGRSPSGKRHGLYIHPERRARGESHGMAKLNPAKAKEIRTRIANGEVQSDLATEFGVSKSLVTWIKQGTIWAE